jgi:hypothetical protein
MEGKPVNKNHTAPETPVRPSPRLACGFSAGTARAALTDPAQIQTEAYVNLVQADQSLDAGRMDEALAQYQAARDYYLQLAKDFPGWEPRVIQYRKTYCDNQIADIERRLAGGSPEELPELAPRTVPLWIPPEIPIAAPAAPAAAPVVVAPPTLQRPPSPDRSVEIDYLKSRIASLETELADVDSIQEQLDALTAENVKLRKDLDAAVRIAEQEDGRLSTIAGLRDELAAKDKQIQSLRKNLDSKKQLDQALNDLESQARRFARTKRAASKRKSKASIRTSMTPKSAPTKPS